MGVATYNAGADLIMERALSTTALDLRAAHVESTTGATDIANLVSTSARASLNTVADVEALTNISVHADRVALTGEASTEVDGSNWAEVDSADVVFPSAAGVTAWGWIVYDEGGGTDATRTVIYGQSFASGQPVDGGLTVQVAGLLRVSTAFA
jgi:hypothetical protein